MSRLRIAFLQDRPENSMPTSVSATNGMWPLLLQNVSSWWISLRILAMPTNPKSSPISNVHSMSSFQRIFSLIVPAASDTSSSLWVGKMPHIFAPDCNGVMLVKSVSVLTLTLSTRFYFTILRKHARAFDADTPCFSSSSAASVLTMAHIVILEEATATQAENHCAHPSNWWEYLRCRIHQAMPTATFTRWSFSPEKRSSCVPSLESLRICRPAQQELCRRWRYALMSPTLSKRKLAIFQRRRLLLEDAAHFLQVYNAHKDLGSIYLSHLIYSMLLDRDVFHPIQVAQYQDSNI